MIRFVASAAVLVLGMGAVAFLVTRGHSWRRCRPTVVAAISAERASLRVGASGAVSAVRVHGPYTKTFRRRECR